MRRLPGEFSANGLWFSTSRAARRATSLSHTLRSAFPRLGWGQALADTISRYTAGYVL